MRPARVNQSQAAKQSAVTVKLHKAEIHRHKITKKCSHSSFVWQQWCLKTFCWLTNNHSNQSGDHGPSGPSPLPQHTRLYQPLIEGLGVHHSTRENITQGVGKPSVSCVSTIGDVFFPSIANQPGWYTEPAAAADPNSALQARVFEESRFFGELYRARFVPQSPWSPAGGAAGNSVQTAGRRSVVLCFMCVWSCCQQLIKVIISFL